MSNGNEEDFITIYRKIHAQALYMVAVMLVARARVTYCL